MNSSDILLSLAHESLEVWKVGDTLCVKYHDSMVSDGPVLIDKFGRGSTFEDACADYLTNIRGKKLVFEGGFHTRKEITVLG